MLTDVIIEEDFEHKEEESWYSKKDLERDLHLAAELGKTLLDRNHELEQGLQQMYSTNQEQLQEIEYLTKQVDLLRQMNEQHAKVYEQLDIAARDLEQSNHRLVLDNRAAQHKIQSLTEMIDGLQMQMEGLQRQVEELKSAQSERCRRDLTEQRRCLGAQSISCLKELYDLQHDKFVSSESLRGEQSWPALDSCLVEEENSSMQRSVETLQAQLASERARREGAEREMALTLQENDALEQRLALLEGSRRRQAELEAEVEELRQLWRAETASARRVDLLLPDAVFFPAEEKAAGDDKAEEAGPEAGASKAVIRGRRRCSSEVSHAEEIRRRHDRTCIRRAQAVKQRGISLLNEVDAQYSALQVKYEELLRRCQQGADSLSHKAVQTPAAQASTHPHAPDAPSRAIGSTATAAGGLSLADEIHQPEYKALFKEIFTCIQKTKEDLSENRNKPSLEE
ncbi:cerebellar degeneration-related protein 2 [Chanos chanos]|uniref:Cerebellar degeneration-related protein 2 n=1 Tax=Chanos chanos TaxID=29144 RepID=A0A6J2WM09_CHACN|nr:cerebellar degeneration-related protein 2-like [Chanos chanos]